MNTITQFHIFDVIEKIKEAIYLFECRNLYFFETKGFEHSRTHKKLYTNLLLDYGLETDIPFCEFPSALSNMLEESANRGALSQKLDDAFDSALIKVKEMMEASFSQITNHYEETSNKYRYAELHDTLHGVDSVVLLVQLPNNPKIGETIIVRSGDNHSFTWLAEVTAIGNNNMAVVNRVGPYIHNPLD